MTALITGAHAASPPERKSSAELVVSALHRLESQGSKTEHASPATVAELAARIQFTVGDEIDSRAIT